MNLTEITGLDITNDVWLLIKIAIIIFMVVYFAFSVIVVRQSKLMEETLDVEFDKVIVLIARIHLLAALIVLVSAVVFL